MKTFKFELPYHQRRARTFTGWAKCAIDAENLGDALRIFEDKSRDGDYEEFGTYIFFVDDLEQDQNISHWGPCQLPLS